MYKLLIVDDETEIAEDISTSIDWEKEGIEVCGCASNGLEAIDIINALKPDIVILDINMPVVNGLELMQKIHEEKLDIQFIILSGYDEFEYARKAMGLGAKSYLLKPCMPHDILYAVLTVKELLDASRKKVRLLDYYEDYFQYSLPQVKENFLVKLVKGYIKNRGRILEEIERYNINLPESNLAAVVFEVLERSSQVGGSDARNADSLKSCIADAASSLEASSPVITDPFACDDYIVFLCSTKTGFPSHGPVHFFDRMRRLLKQKYNVQVLIGIGAFVKSYEDLPESYTSSVSAIRKAHFFEENRIITYDEMLREEQNTSFYPSQEEADILNSLHAVDKASILRKVDDLYHSVLLQGVRKKEYVKEVSIMLIKNVIQSCLDEQMDMQAMLNEQMKLFDNIVSCETMSRLKEIVSDFLCKAAGLSAQQNNANNLVSIAINYIHKNYSRELNLETLAQQVFITPGYLSILFKQETGINFIDYLHKYRIQMSKKLMKDPQYKIYKISGMVGFRNAKHFSQVFKKYTGLTPKEYREQSCGSVIIYD